MFFHRKKSTAEPPKDQQVAPVTQENAPVAEPVTEPTPFGPSSILFGRFLRNQQAMGGPEASYENEAWVPEIESVGLFHKHRATVEEQSSSSSGPQ